MNALTTVTLNEYLLVGAMLFAIGALVVMTRRNAVAVLMGVELILNAASLNFVAFEHFGGGESDVTGQVFAVFIIVLAASEAAIALAIVLQVYRNYRSIMADRLTALKN